MRKIVAPIRKFIIKHIFKTIKAEAGNIPTSILVEKIFLFCEAYSGKVMYKYQEQFSKRVIRSTLENDGAEITALFARQSGKTETIAITVGGMMIILPQLANMPMFYEDKRLSMFRDGFWVGIFSPSLRQSQITYNRMRSRLSCKQSQAVLEDPDFRLEFTTSNGQTVALSNGSYCSAISASDNSNIEGDTYKFIIIEECFVKGTPILTKSGYKNIENVEVGEEVYSFNHSTGDVELKKVERSFNQPVYNRKIVKIISESGKEIVCTDNHKIHTNRGYIRADHLRSDDLMLLYTHTTQESEDEVYVKSNDFGNNARGRKYIIPGQEILEVSEIHSKSIFKTGRVCDEEVRESERILSDRSKDSKKFGKRSIFVSLYNKMSSRNKGILRFILQRREESDTPGNTRFNERRSLSVLVSRRWKFSWDDVYSHAMLFFRRKRNFSDLVNREVRDNSIYTDRQENKSTISVLQRKGEEQVSEVDRALCDSVNAIQDSHNRYSDTMCDMWERSNTLSSEESSLLLGEMPKRISTTVFQGVCKEEGIKSIEIIDTNEVVVYDLTVEDNHNFFANGLLVHNCQDVSNFKIRKSIHPMAAAYNGSICKIGTATTFKGDFYEAIERNKKEWEEKKTTIKNHFEYNYKVVMKYNPKYEKYIEREKRSLGENSDEFRMSYNLEWIIARGMFVDIDEFERTCGEEYLDRVSTDLKAKHVVGIDVGGGSAKGNYADSTVITVLEVDWDNPAVLESTRDEETGEDIIYSAYNTYIKDWFEITPDLAADYNEQYEMIMAYLKRYRVVRLVIDATREASLGQRIAANVNFDVELFTFSSRSKSDLYKHLQTEINTGRARFPMSKEVIESKEYKKFNQQYADLQKSYSGSNLVVSHPEERGAHDDYPDSHALAVWGAREPGQVDNTETLIRKDVMNEKPVTMVFRTKNRYTARRR